jgi:hypothetical protein
MRTILALLMSAFLYAGLASGEAQQLSASPIIPVSSTAFEPQKMSSMPPLSAIPRSGMTAAQVEQECVRLFNNREYTILLAEQRPGKDKNNWPYTNNVEAKFAVAVQSIDVEDGRPVCLITYNWRFNSKNLITDWAPAGAKFDGKIAYYHRSDGGGFILVAQGDTLAFTNFFYYKDPKTKVPNTSLGIHQAWGTYTLSR